MFKVKVLDEKSQELAEKYDFQTEEFMKLEDGDVIFVRGSALDVFLETASLLGIAKDVIFIAPDTEETVYEFFRESFGLSPELLKDKKALKVFISFVRETGALLRESEEIEDELKNLALTVELYREEKKIKEKEKEKALVFKATEGAALEEIESEIYILDYKIFLCETKNILMLVKVVNRDGEEHLRVLRIKGYGRRTPNANIAKRLKEFAQKIIKEQQKRIVFKLNKVEVVVEDITQNVFIPEPCEGYLLFLKEGGEWKTFVPRQGAVFEELPLTEFEFEDYYILPLFEFSDSFIDSAYNFNRMLEDLFGKEKGKENEYENFIKRTAKFIVKSAVFEKKRNIHEQLDQEGLSYLEEFLFDKVEEYYFRSKEREIYRELSRKLNELLKNVKNEEEQDIYKMGIASLWKLFVDKLENETARHIGEFWDYYLKLTEGEDGEDGDADFFIGLDELAHQEPEEEKIDIRKDVKNLIENFVERMIESKKRHPRILVFGIFWITSFMKDACKHGDSNRLAERYLEMAPEIPVYEAHKKIVIPKLTVIPYEVNSEDCLKILEEVLEKIQKFADEYGLHCKRDNLATLETIRNYLSSAKRIVKEIFKEGFAR